MQRDNEDDDAPTEEVMVGFFKDLATKCHAYYDPLPIASNTYPYMPREEYAHLIGHAKATSRVKAIARVLVAHPEILLVSELHCTALRRAVPCKRRSRCCCCSHIHRC